jgi:hypothetical protein
MRVLAIDPGNKTSGWVLMDGRTFLSGESEQDNTELHRVIESYRDVDLVACEWIQSYGMTVGKEVFHTCRWSGRFQQVAESIGLKWALVYRRDVKLYLCQDSRAKDTNVRQAILDLYPATGGGSRPQIGTKKQRGPLYGVSGHMWPAVGLALTVQESNRLSEVECVL